MMGKEEQKEKNLWEIYNETQLEELENLNEAYKLFWMRERQSGNA